MHSFCIELQAMVTRSQEDIDNKLLTNVMNASQIRHTQQNEWDRKKAPALAFLNEAKNTRTVTMSLTTASMKQGWGTTLFLVAYKIVLAINVVNMVSQPPYSAYLSTVV